MKQSRLSPQRANRRFYDLAAEVYERVDGRRGENTHRWLDSVLRELALLAPDGPLLEIGCGSGWLLDAASNHFPVRYGCDISPGILKLALPKSDGVACGAGEHLPFASNTFGSAVFYATLHHVPDWEPVLEEAYRVLMPGGWIYCDHDMDSAFLTRFRIPIAIYRFLMNPQKRYQKACPDLTADLYYKSEHHEETGVSAERLKAILQDCGFVNIRIEWHWMGLNPIADSIGKIFKTAKREARAPLLRILAQKSTIDKG